MITLLIKWALNPLYFFMAFEDKKTDNIEETIRVLVEPLVLHAGMELLGVEYAGSRLVLTIDKPGGVTVDDCAHVSRIVGDLLDIKDPVPGRYNLEVSSPGINRPLTREEDFTRFAGEKIVLKTKDPINGRRRFKGTLEGMEDGLIRLSSGKDTFEIPFDRIARARLDIL